MSDPKTAQVEETFYSKLGIPLASLKAARSAIEANRHTGNVVCLVGDAGIGKTHLIRQIGAARVPTKPFDWNGQRWETETPVVAVYLQHRQPEDMGVPYPTRAKRNEILKECGLFLQVADLVRDDEDQRSLFDGAREHAIALSRHLLASGSPLDDGTFEFLIERHLKNLPPEGILFLDEWNRADKAVVKAFFTLLEDREIHGIRVVPPGVQIVAAMNPSDGAYSVNESEKDHAIRRRLSFIAVQVNQGAWVEHATKSKFHPLVVDYIKASPNALHDTKLRDAGKTYPNPAAWEKVSITMLRAEEAGLELTHEGVQLAIKGIIGDTAGAEFESYVRETDSVIHPDEVLKSYTEKSRVRKKVSRMVTLARNDVIIKLCQAVSAELFRAQPEPKSISMALALFMSDLAPEHAGTMVEVHFKHDSQNNDGGQKYLHDLSKAMFVHESYQKIFDRMGDAMRKVREDAAGEKILNPLAP